MERRKVCLHATHRPDWSGSICRAGSNNYHLWCWNKELFYKKKGSSGSFWQIINSVTSELKEVQKINKYQHYYKFSRWNMKKNTSRHMVSWKSKSITYWGNWCAANKTPFALGITAAVWNEGIVTLKNGWSGAGRKWQRPLNPLRTDAGCPRLEVSTLWGCWP